MLMPNSDRRVLTALMLEKVEELDMIHVIHARFHSIVLNFQEAIVS
jgi:hypothetical protein